MLPCISKTAFSTVFADKIASLSSHSNAKQNEVSQSRRCLPPPASRRGPGRSSRSRGGRRAGPGKARVRADLQDRQCRYLCQLPVRCQVRRGRDLWVPQGRETHLCVLEARRLLQRGLVSMTPGDDGLRLMRSSSWDQVTYLKTTCYVNGYFTDSNCSSSMLSRC